MKAPTLLLILSSVAGVVSLGTALIVQRAGNQVLRFAQQEHRLAREAMSAQLVASESKQAQTAFLLAAREEELAALKNRLARLEESAAEAMRAAAAVSPGPYPVRAYLGSDSLGFAWVKPTNIVRDARTGRVTFDPVLVLDESFRRAVSSPISESAREREVVRYETVNYTWHPAPVWFVPPVYCPLPPKSEPVPPAAAPTKPPGGGSPCMPVVQTAPRYAPTSPTMVASGASIQRPIASAPRIVPQRPSAFVPAIRQTQTPSTVR